MEYKGYKKEVHWFCRIELNRRKTQGEAEPAEKILELNTAEKKSNNNNGKFLKGKCNKCGKYGHRASECWGKRNKNDNINDNKNARNQRFVCIELVIKSEMDIDLVHSYSHLGEKLLCIKYNTPSVKFIGTLQVYDGCAQSKERQIREKGFLWTQLVHLWIV